MAQLLIKYIYNVLATIVKCFAIVAFSMSFGYSQECDSRHFVSFPYNLFVGDDTTFVIENNGLFSEYEHLGTNNFTSPSYALDTNGDVLFYSDGISVYSRNHNIMPNGYDLTGDRRTVQSNVILPVSDDPNLYFIVTNGRTPRTFEDHGLFDSLAMLNYSIVDVSLNDGMGDIMEGKKNYPILRSDTKGMTWIKGYCDENWIVNFTSDSIYILRSFKDSLILYSTQERFFSSGIDDRSSLYASLDGNYLFHVNRAFRRQDTSYTTLFSFDNYSGQLVVESRILSHEPTGFQRFVAFHAAFASPFLYVLYLQDGGCSALINRQLSCASLIRYDFRSEEISKIVNSRRVLLDSLIFPNGIFGIHDKLYFYFSAHLSGLEEADTEDSYYVDTLLLLPTPGHMEFPQVAACRKEKIILNDESILIDTLVICDDGQFLKVGTDYEGSEVKWSSGDSADSIYISEEGEYSVMIRSDDFCEILTDTTIVVFSTRDVNLGWDTTICIGDTISTDWSADYVVEWEDSFAGANRQFYHDGQFSFYYMDRFGCLHADTLNISTYAEDYWTYIDDNNVCDSGQVDLFVEGRYDQVIWSNGDIGPTYRIYENGLYLFDVIDGDCIYHDSLYVDTFSSCKCHYDLPNVLKIGLGDNGKFQLTSNCAIQNYVLEIFTRWGSQIFMSTNLDFSWSPTEEISSGVYVYKMSFVDQYGPQQIVGTLALVK